MNDMHNSIEVLHAVGGKSDNVLDGLRFTPRGKEVFRLMLEGLSDKQIAVRLGISYSGVRRHKEKMLLVNGCASILELIAKYHESKLKNEPVEASTATESHHQSRLSEP